MNNNKDDFKKIKENLLKSGLPLEYEVIKFFHDHSMLVQSELEYTRKSETNEMKYFSYDIETGFYKNNHNINLLIECKYRSEGTNWFFLPYIKHFFNDDNLSFNSFLHSDDYFNIYSSLANIPLYDNAFGFLVQQFSQKGYEIKDNNHNDISITKAISQLSYGFIDRITASLKNIIISNEYIRKSIEINVPIIITTAKLYRLKETSTIKNINDSEDIKDICEKVDFINYILPYSRELISHNQLKLRSLFRKYKISIKNINKNLNKDYKSIDDLVANISRISPRSILIMNHDNENKNLEKLLSFLNNICDTDNEETNIKINEISKELQNMKIKGKINRQVKTKRKI